MVTPSCAGGAGTNYYVDPGVNAFSAVGAPPNLKVVSFFTGSNSPYSLSQTATTDVSSLPDIVYGSADPKDHSPAVTYSGNLALARVFPCSIDIEISYVGNTTRNLNGYSATNVVPVGSETTNNDFGPYFGGNGTFRLPCIHGPAYFNDELGIFKDFKIGDAGKLQIRLQGFNFLNRRFDTYQQYGSSLYLGFHDVGIVPDNVANAGTASNLTGHRSL